MSPGSIVLMQKAIEDVSPQQCMDIYNKVFEWVEEGSKWMDTPFQWSRRVATMCIDTQNLILREVQRLTAFPKDVDVDELWKVLLEKGGLAFVSVMDMIRYFVMRPSMGGV